MRLSSDSLPARRPWPARALVSMCGVVAMCSVAYAGPGPSAPPPTAKLRQGVFDPARGCVSASGRTPPLRTIKDGDPLGPCLRFTAAAELPQHLAGIDLRGSHFERAALRGRSLDRAALDRVEVREGVLTRLGCVESSLTYADMRGVSAADSTWRGCRLDGADLRAAKLARARMEGVSLRGARMTHAFLAHATFRGVDFAGADLSEAVLASTDLRGSLFDGATKLPFSEVEAVRRGMVKK